MRFGPEFDVAVFDDSDVLQGRPAKDSIVADKGSHIAVADTISNGCVDQVGEEGDAFLKVGGCNVHDTGAELQNSDFGRDLQFRDGIK